MNIKVEKIDDVNAQIAISVTKNDCQFLVQKSLNDLCKSVVIAGFRKGNVPKSIVQSMYGKNVLIEELNKLVLNKLSEYIEENKLCILGEPVLIENNIDLNNQENYEFLFDIGLQPKVNISLTKDDELSYFTIVITDEMIENQINAIKMQFNEYDTNVSAIENDNDIIKGKFAELNRDNIMPLKGGISLNDVALMLFSIRDEMEKAKFIDKKVGDVVIFNPYKAFKKHETGLSHLFRIKEAEVINHQGNFSFTITEINRYKQTEINQELFDKLYGVGVVTSEEMFKEKIKKSLALQLQIKSDYRFFSDIKQLLLEKIKEIQFPEYFLKRWLMKTDTKIKEETIEKDFPNILRAIKTQFIWNKIVEDNEIKVTLEDMQQAAKILARMQFSLYNLHIVADNVLENYADKILKTEKWIQQLRDRALEIKIIDFLKEKISLRPINITEEEFLKLSENF